jgi:hypothetical protein
MSRNGADTVDMEILHCIFQGNGFAGEFTLTLHTYTGKNRCARAIARHLRLCSPQTGLHVR